MSNIKTVQIPNLLAMDEPITCELHKSDYPNCKENCNHYKEKGKCVGCNNYKFTTFWPDGNSWKGLER